MAWKCGNFTWNYYLYDGLKNENMNILKETETTTVELQ